MVPPPFILIASAPSTMTKAQPTSQQLLRRLLEATDPSKRKEQSQRKVQKTAIAVGEEMKEKQEEQQNEEGQHQQRLLKRHARLLLRQDAMFRNANRTNERTMDSGQKDEQTRRKRARSQPATAAAARTSATHQMNEPTFHRKKEERKAKQRKMDKLASVLRSMKDR